MPKSKINPLVKPYLKWAGGKRQLLPHIRRHMPENLLRYTYYEPFVGAGAVLFAMQPRRATINDCNEQLISTYRAIQDNVEELIAALRVHAARNSEEYYYAVREMDRHAESFERLPGVERAARVIYLNKTCYNGLYRVNTQGLFNVPYGRYTRPVICEEAVLRAVHTYLCKNGVRILNGDFSAAVQEADQRSFVYFDPPYHSPNNTNFTGYRAGGFDEPEQARLRNTFAELADRGVKCLLSNADTEFIRELYRGFVMIEVQARRAINSDAAGRGNARELLVKSWR